MEPNESIFTMTTTRLEDYLDNLTRDELNALGAEQLAVKIDGRLGDDTVRDQLKKIVVDQRNQAMSKTRDSAEQASSSDDPLVKIRFFNLEFSGVPAEFNFAGPKGMYGPKNPDGHKKIPQYHLKDGVEYDLPLSVVNHLKSLYYIKSNPVVNESGQIESAGVEHKPRYMCELVMTDDQIKQLGKET